MIILDQYIQLWLQFANNENIEEKLEISIQNISEALFCTTRNSKLIIKKLEELQWIYWQSGRGRGNRSSIVFRYHPVTLILEEGKEITKKGDIKGGKAFIEQYIRYFPNLPHQFEKWIDSIFGYHMEATEQGRQDILRLQMNIENISNFDPILASLRSDCHIIKHIYDTLIYINAHKNVIEPRLAFHWEYDPTRKVWTFYLRKGVLCHNGKVFTAKDVIYTFERFRNKKDNPYLWMLDYIKEIQEINDYTVEIHLHRENEFFLQTLGAEQCSIVTEDERGDLVGTGPFKLKEHNEKWLVLEAHPSYFRERPFLDRLEFWKETEHGEVYDVFSTAQHREKIYHQNISEIEKNVTYVTFNINKEGPLQDESFRQALYQIIRTNNLVEELAGDRDNIAYEFMLGKKDSVETKEDIHELIRRSEYNGEILYLYTFLNEDHVEDSTWIQRQCRKYGIFIEISFLEAKDLLLEKTIQEAHIIHDSATISEQIEMSFLFLFLSKNSFIHQHSSLLFQNQLASFFAEKSQKKRIMLLGQLEDHLLQHIHIIPLYRNKQQITTHKKVQNAAINSQGWIDFYHIWFKP